MSKLYLQGGTDARRTSLTARAHKWARMNFLYNWRGGNVAEGSVDCFMEHLGNTVQFFAHIKGTRDGFFVKFFPDGTYKIEKHIFYPAGTEARSGN